MKNEFFVIIILAIIANFIFLSFGYTSDPGVSIQAVVPLTDKNVSATLESTLNKSDQDKEPISKENKYLQFFAKSQEIEAQNQKNPAAQFVAAQTVHDKFSSYGLMVLVLLVCASVLVFILRLIERFSFHHKIP